ncbi:hypothetical protein SSS_04934 [Sarcoptes scabiei]|uniref:Uncharacterized protein n=1 Tax=Sarcoptes scabiei TaxID=52283 RepID=A0A834R793_SARSC|nr:hypothetical protein SSS_04934 [Sarcoptes scabiei]
MAAAELNFHLNAMFAKVHESDPHNHHRGHHHCYIEEHRHHHHHHHHHHNHHHNHNDHRGENNANSGDHQRQPKRDQPTLHSSQSEQIDCDGRSHSKSLTNKEKSFIVEKTKPETDLIRMEIENVVGDKAVIDDDHHVFIDAHFIGEDDSNDRNLPDPENLEFIAELKKILGKKEIEVDGEIHSEFENSFEKQSIENESLADDKVIEIVDYHLKDMEKFEGNRNEIISPTTDDQNESDHYRDEFDRIMAMFESQMFVASNDQSNVDDRLYEDDVENDENEQNRGYEHKTFDVVKDIERRSNLKETATNNQFESIHSKPKRVNFRLEPIKQEDFVTRKKVSQLREFWKGQLIKNKVDDSN